MDDIYTVENLKKDLKDVLQAYIEKCAFWGSMGCGRCSAIRTCKYFSMLMKIERDLK